MTGNIVYCAFWVLYIVMPFEFMNAAPMGNDNLLQNKYGHLSEKQKDCQVNKKYEDSQWSGESVPFTVYVEENEEAGTVSFSITYDGRDTDLVRDKLILSQKENKIYEYRNGNIEPKSLETYVDVSGWTQMEISMNGQHIIVKVMGIVTLNHTGSYPVKGLVIHGSNITICEDNTPTWLVQKEVFAKIPLEPSRQVVNHYGNRIYVLTLSSENEFTPCIGIGGDRKCLTQGNLMERRFELYLELLTGHINIYQEIEGKRKNIGNFYKREMKFIEVSSHNNKFSVSLTIFAQPKAFPPDSVSTDNSDYGTVIYLSIGIAIGIVSSLATVAIVFMVLRRKMVVNNENNSTETLNKNDTTTSQHLLHVDKYNG